MDYADGWTWFDSDGNVLSDENVSQMTTEEMIDTTIIYSAKGLLKDSFSLITKRPFRNPSLAVTQAGMFGGGMTPQPGEISLAHHGV